MQSPALLEGGTAKFLSLRAAAHLLGLHPNTVRAHVLKGMFPGAKVGRGWLFLEADLVAWIRSGYPEAAQVFIWS